MRKRDTVGTLFEKTEALFEKTDKALFETGMSDFERLIWCDMWKNWESDRDYKE